MSFDPDAQLDDWYQWSVVQAGHSALVGVPAALVLLPWFSPFLAPLIVAAAYLVLWEIAVQRVGSGWKDALEDTACVMAGASMICGALVGFWSAVLCFGLWAAFLAVGVVRRGVWGRA